MLPYASGKSLSLHFVDAAVGMYTFKQLGLRLLATAVSVWETYPRHITAMALALVTGGVGGALALVTVGPDAADLPVQLITEHLALEPSFAQQAHTLENTSLSLSRSDTTRSSDTPESLLRRLGVADAGAVQFLKQDPLSQRLLLGRAGRAVRAETTGNHALTQLTARWVQEDDGQFQRLVLTRNPAGAWSSTLQTAPLVVNSRVASGIIRSSLFAATDDARLPDAVAVQLADIFSGDIDFHRALRKGDRFSLVYESLEADGEPMRAGRVQAAEFVNNGKTFQAMWFAEPGKTQGGYYTLDGQSLRRAYLASPMEFSRISSGFKMRFHPILQTWRAHLGVDYAAPTGTAVRSVGDGVVEFAGTQSGFGNVVFVQHRRQHTTVYAHLSRINVRKGQTVSQGQNIGLVGATGWATGPHLHFEFRVNGAHQDPLTLARQSESVPVASTAMGSFKAKSGYIRTHLAAASNMASSVE
jgi:murein DD-endopeptidase MepM/ murein hydrolase activator NlpD